MYEWITCPSCGHKLFRADGSMVVGGWASSCKIEIKCHSCKRLVFIDVNRYGHIKEIIHKEGKK